MSAPVCFLKIQMPNATHLVHVEYIQSMSRYKEARSYEDPTQVLFKITGRTKEMIILFETSQEAQNAFEQYEAQIQKCEKKR